MLIETGGVGGGDGTAVFWQLVVAGLAVEAGDQEVVKLAHGFGNLGAVDDHADGFFAKGDDGDFVAVDVPFDRRGVAAFRYPSLG